MDENDKVTPITASEMGKRGAAVRWDSNRRLSRPKNLTLNNNAPERLTIHRLANRIQRALEDRLIHDNIIPWRLHPRLRGKTPEQYIDTYWARSLPREWEQLLDLAKAQGNLQLVKEVLLAMTAMTGLSPLKAAKHARESDSPPLPSSADLSHLSDDELTAATGRPMLTVVSSPQKRGGAKEELPPVGA